MEAPCMCQSSWFGLELGTGDGWGVGTDTSALTRDCPKPTVLIRIKPIISLSVFAPCTSLHRPPFLPPFFLSHPRICSLPLSCCSFSCSCLTLPSQPYNLNPKKTKTKTMLRTGWPASTLSLLFPLVPLICSEWSLGVDFRKSIFNVWAPIYVILDRLMCCQGNCHSYYRHGEPSVEHIGRIVGGASPLVLILFSVSRWNTTNIYSLIVIMAHWKKEWYTSLHVRITAGRIFVCSRYVREMEWNMKYYLPQGSGFFLSPQDDLVSQINTSLKYLWVCLCVYETERERDREMGW